MLILGLCGGLDRPRPADDSQEPMTLDTWYHDSAAVIVRNGRILAAVEEERVNRIKHSGHRPEEAIRACCRQAGVSIGDVDRIAYFMDEANLDTLVRYKALRSPHAAGAHSSGRTFLASALSVSSGVMIDANRLRFVEHHRCHAMSAWCTSGREDTLIVTLDGEGDLSSGAVYQTNGRSLACLRKIPAHHSLGNLYTQVTMFLGFKPRDEFKVMGLAPYGDPSAYRPLFEQLITLGQEGKFLVHLERLPALLRLFVPRRAHEPLTPDHHAVAAALQVSLQNTVLHMLRHFRETTGQRHLCLAGGVAQNCAMTGVVERSGLFDSVFVCPASHDAGCAIGAAMAVHADEARPDEPIVLRATMSPFLGTPLDESAMEERLAQWAPLIRWERPPEIVAASAQLLADGEVLGWMQGRAEFGPRALGHRSILADARPAHNKDRVNALVKKREAFRPFAPSVPLEDAHRFFDVPAGHEYPHMSVVVKVRPEYCETLGAVTHVDGTARLQTVTPQDNERFHDLLNAFGQLTGVPVLLNTSFNNNSEPIADSIDDGIACLLTTGIDHLVAGTLLVSRGSSLLEGLTAMAVALHPHLELRESNVYDDRQGRRVTRHVVTNDYSDKYYMKVDKAISAAVHRLLQDSDPSMPVGVQLRGLDEGGGAAVLVELFELWEARLVTLRPPCPGVRC